MHVLEAGNRARANESEYTSLRGEWWTTNFKRCHNIAFPFVTNPIADIKGCHTLRIFDCLQAGCIPIYLGTPDITDYIPSNTFVNKRKFTYPELLEYLESVEQEEFEEYLQNIQVFLNSDEARHTSRETGG